MQLGCSFSLLLLVHLALCTAPRGPWDDYNYAPDSRTVSPQSVVRTEGSISNAKGLLGGDKGAILAGNGSYVTVDFGFEVRGRYVLLQVSHDVS